MNIRFTKHAVDKFEVLKRHGVQISRREVLRTIIEPDYIDYRRRPLLIVQSNLNKSLVLRVVYKKDVSGIIIITFYPGRKSQYEKKGTEN